MNIKKAPKYSKKKLIDNAVTIFDKPKYVVVGALVDCKSDMTIGEAKKKINEFLKRKVKN